MTAPLIISTPLELNHVMLAAAIQAFKDLFTPPFRAVLLKCVGLTIGLLALLIILLEGLFGHFVDWPWSHGMDSRGGYEIQVPIHRISG